MCCAANPGLGRPARMSRTVHVRLVTDEMAIATRTTCPPPRPAALRAVETAAVVDGGDGAGAQGAAPAHRTARIPRPAARAEPATATRTRRWSAGDRPAAAGDERAGDAATGNPTPEARGATIHHRTPSTKQARAIPCRRRSCPSNSATQNAPCARRRSRPGGPEPGTSRCAAPTSSTRLDGDEATNAWFGDAHRCGIRRARSGGRCSPGASGGPMTTGVPTGVPRTQLCMVQTTTTTQLWVQVSAASSPPAVARRRGHQQTPTLLRARRR